MAKYSKKLFFIEGEVQTLSLDQTEGLSFRLRVAEKFLLKINEKMMALFVSGTEDRNIEVVDKCVDFTLEKLDEQKQMQSSILLGIAKATHSRVRIHVQRDAIEGRNPPYSVRKLEIL